MGEAYINSISFTLKLSYVLSYWPAQYKSLRSKILFPEAINPRAYCFRWGEKIIIKARGLAAMLMFS